MMVENDSGFSIVIGGRAVKAELSGRDFDANLTMLTVAAADVDAAADGAAVSVTSGGSVWSFGALRKAMIH